jgi:hypothetical protein
LLSEDEELEEVEGAGQGGCAAAAEGVLAAAST